jgi:hypothetical protein
MNIQVNTVDGNTHDLSDYYFGGVMDGRILFNFKVAAEVTDKGVVRTEGLSFALDEVDEISVD